MNCPVMSSPHSRSLAMDLNEEPRFSFRGLTAEAPEGLQARGAGLASCPSSPCGIGPSGRRCPRAPLRAAGGGSGPRGRARLGAGERAGSSSLGLVLAPAPSAFAPGS